MDKDLTLEIEKVSGEPFGILDEAALDSRLASLEDLVVDGASHPIPDDIPIDEIGNWEFDEVAQTWKKKSEY